MKSFQLDDPKVSTCDKMANIGQWLQVIGKMGISGYVGWMLLKVSLEDTNPAHLEQRICGITCGLMMFLIWSDYFKIIVKGPQ